MTNSPISIDSTESLNNNSNSNSNTDNLAHASNEQEQAKPTTEESTSTHPSADTSETLNDTQTATANWGNALKNGAEYSKYAIQKGYEYAKAAYDPTMKGIEWGIYCIQNVSWGAHKAFDSAHKICSAASTVFGWMNEHPITTAATTALWYSGMLPILLHCAPVITPVVLCGIYLYEDIRKESTVTHEKHLEHSDAFTCTNDMLPAEEHDTACTGVDISTQYA